MEGHSRRAALLALAAAAAHVLALGPSLYGDGASLAEAAPLFTLVRAASFGLSALVLWAGQHHVGAGLLVGASLAALRFVLLYLAVALDEGWGLGLALVTLGEAAALAGAWIAGRDLMKDFSTRPANLHFAVIAGAGGLLYTLGEALPKQGPLVSGGSESPFSHGMAVSIASLLGMAIILAIPLIAAFLGDLRAGAALVAGALVLFMGEIASNVSLLTQAVGADPALLLPAIGIGLALELIAAGLLLVALFVITPLGRRISGA